MEKKQSNTLAVNFTRLSNYNFELISLEEVIFLEYLIVLSNQWKGEFYKPASMITEDTGIRRARLERIISNFEKRGWLATQTKGFPLVRYFILNMDAVTETYPTFQKSKTSKDSK